MTIINEKVDKMLTFSALNCGDVFKRENETIYYLKCTDNIVADLATGMVYEADLVEYDTLVEKVKCHMVVE